MLFHKDLGLPSFLKLPKGEVTLVHSAHAKRAADSDRYGEIELPDSINLDGAEIIEVEASGPNVLKAVYRIPYCFTYDLILVIIPENESCFLKTAWLNAANDKHETLDVSRYTICV